MQPGHGPCHDRTAKAISHHEFAPRPQFAHEIAVMYAGKIVEQAETPNLFRNPRQPYTRGLLRSLPSARNRGERLPTIPGIVPDLRTLPTGCRFQDRCDLVSDVCRAEEPTLRQLDQSEVSCFRAEGSA